MAVIDKKGRLHGKVANHVYRTVGDTNIVQSKAAKVKQTSATKESALEFGLASNCGRIIRSIYPSLCLHSDAKMINRLNSTLFKCIKDSEKERGERDLHDGNLDHLRGFQFNANSSLQTVLAVRPISSLNEQGKIQVEIPAFNVSTALQSIKKSHRCVLRMMLIALNFRKDYFEYLSYQDLNIPSSGNIAAQKWIPDVALPAGSLLLVSVSLHYFGVLDVAGVGMNLNNPTFNPAELIGIYLAPEREDVEGNTEKRYPLTNYRGAEILNEIVRLRKKNKVKSKQVVSKGDGVEPPFVV